MASDISKNRGPSLAERKQEAKRRLQAQYQKEVAAWLAAKPHIGALNSGKFYKMVGDKLVDIKPLEPEA